MRFPLTDELLADAARFALCSACRDCVYALGAPGAERCLHDWPNEAQRRWPLDAPGPDGARPDEVAFCKEFELA